MSEKKSEKAFYLLRLKEGGDPAQAFRKLGALNGVQSREALRGEFHLILSLEGELADLQKMASEGAGAFADVEDARFLCVTQMQENPSPEGKHVAAYVLLEAEQAGVQGLMQGIGGLPHVTRVVALEGDFSLLVKMEAASFFELERVLTGKIRCMPGIVRTRMLKVVNVRDL